MKIGLYFGSFNPVHIGHCIIANHFVQNTDLDRVWLIVSPQNPFKESASLLNEYHRLHLAKLATEDVNHLKASDIEFHLPRPSYTIDTLTYLKEKHPDHEFSIILGSDGLQNLHKWKNADVLAKNYRLLVYKRPGFEIVNTLQAKMEVAEAPLLEISSTYIREMIRQGKSIRYLVPDKVRDEIELYHYYK
ncbi:MAG: nicotinate (nicotinamide) nucleotide adenylyltransferase [Chitinophagaceae bacterium]